MPKITKKPLFKPSIRLVFLGTNITVLLIMICVIGIYSYYKVTNFYRESTYNKLFTTNSQIEAKLREFLEVPHQMNSLALKYIQAEKIDKNQYLDLSSLLLAQLLEHPKVMSTEYADEDNNTIGYVRNVFPGVTLAKGINIKTEKTIYSLFETDPANINKQLVWELPDYDARERPWYKQALEAKKSAWTPIYFFPEDTGIGFDAVTPITQNEKIIGVLDTSYLLKDVKVMMQSLQVYQDSFIYLVEPSGEVITGSDIMTPYTGSGENKQRYQMSESPSTVLKTLAKEINNQVEKINGLAENYILPFKDSHKNYVAAITPLRDNYGLNWKIIHVIPESVAFADLRTASQQIIILLLIVSVASILILIVASNTIIRPITQLAKVARAITQGDFDQTVDINRHDEIGDLANAFISMQRTIKKQILSLTKEIKKRETVEDQQLTNIAKLEKMNKLMIDRELKMVEMKQALKKDK